MASSWSSAVGNKFITVRRRLRAGEHAASLFVKTGKIGVFVRSRWMPGVLGLELIQLIIVSAK